MTKLFFAFARFSVLGVCLAAVAWAADKEKTEAQQWFEEAEKAWEEALVLDDELRAKKAEAEAAAEEGKEPDEEETAKLPKPDFAGAFELFKKSAEAGFSDAALRVSELLLAGRGVPKDTIGAFEWAEKAAAMGNLEAQLLTASKFEEGRGTQKSLSKALALYETALEQGSPVARMKVANLLDRGEPGVEQNRARALPLFQQAARDGDAGAIYMVGLYLQRGYVVEKNEEAASQWFLRGAEIGEARAQRKLAMRYLMGTGVQQNTVEALKWCDLALKNPDGDVETKNLAREYREAIVEKLTPRKIDQAARYVERFKLKTFKDISLPPLPYKGPAPVYHTLADVNGNQLEAAVIAVNAEAVVLERRSDSKRFTVPLKRLSAESLELLKGLE